MTSSTSTSASSSKTGKITPNLDKDGTKILNLTVLQRRDRSVEEILMVATHVTLYQFDIDVNQWSRKDVEGSLFVVKRTTNPRFQFIVMNRRSTENLVEDLLSDFEFEIQVPYLLYRNAAQEVNGIWFYNAQECEDISNLFNRIINSYPKVSPEQEITPSRRELEAVPTSAVIERPLEPSVKPTTSTVQPEDPSFANFFRALNIGNSVPNWSQSGQVYHSSVPTSPLTLAHPSPVPSLQVPSGPETYSFAPTTRTPGDISELINTSNSGASLVKPSSFIAPSSSSSFSVPPVPSTPSTPLHPLLNLHQPHGTPMLQPLPPPTPPPTFTANPTPLNREKVRDALVMLVQDNQFVEMFHQALMKVIQ